MASSKTQNAPAKKTTKEATNLPAYRKELVEAPVNKGIKKEEQIQLFRDMVRIRRFEERTLRAYQQGKIGGFLHLYIGQEAVAVGSISVMGENDHVITAYRDHGHALAVGMTMKECFAELQGKATGCSKGKGGSMHFFAPEKRYWGGHGIVAGQTPLGLGIAYGLKYQGKKGCCLTFMGDGATNQGTFYESLGLAALWDVPVVFIIENNGFSMGTALHRHSRDTELAQRAEVFGMGWGVANGHDIYDVRLRVNEAIERAHNESKPTLLEIDTYRYRGHSVSDPDKTYRTKDEIEEYKKSKDPITLYRQFLLDQKVFDDKQADQIDQEAKDEADEAAQFADDSPFPEVEAITEDVYWETDNPEERTSQGKLFFND